MDFPIQYRTNQLNLMCHWKNVGSVNPMVNTMLHTWTVVFWLQRKRQCQTQTTTVRTIIYATTSHTIVYSFTFYTPLSLPPFFFSLHWSKFIAQHVNISPKWYFCSINSIVKIQIAFRKQQAIEKSRKKKFFSSGKNRNK